MHDQKFIFSEVVFFLSTLLGKSTNVIKLGDTQMFGHFFRSWKLRCVSLVTLQFVSKI